MGKRKTKEQQDKATLAEVIKEMAKPRVAMSAREHFHIVRKEVLVVLLVIKLSQLLPALVHNPAECC